MMRSKRGSSTVFLMMILSTVMSIVLLFFVGARNEYVKSRADAVISLSGDSLMSEYNSYVHKEYGLFVLDGRKSKLTANLRSYLDYSMNGVRGFEIEQADAWCGGYSLADTDLIREQIVEHMKYAAAAGLADSVMKSADQENSMAWETLRNRETIVSLPSYGMAENSLTMTARHMAADPDGIRNAFSDKTDEYMVNRYVMRYFNNQVHSADSSHFFRDEVEYVLGGKLSDKENEKAVCGGLKALRFPLNLQHIYSDPSKMKKLLAAAELLAPEASAAAQFALASAWAYAEADNDVELLLKGYKVPVLKDKSTWAMDLDNVIEGIGGGTAVPDIQKGYDYEEYLQCMLFFVNINVKTARIMDLIQINTRMNSDSDFVIKEHCVGVNIAVRINGRSFRYEKKY